MTEIRNKTDIQRPMTATLRRQIIDLLIHQEMDARQISKAVRIREKEVHDHLDHIARSVEAKKMKFSVTPSRCQKCDYVFKNRKRLNRPSRCPVCRGTWLDEPVYRIINV